MTRLLAVASAALAVAAALVWLRRHGTAAQWAERAQRFPLPALRGAGSRTAAPPAETLHVRELERVELAVSSDVVALVEHDGLLDAGTFDQGALRVAADGRQRRLPLDARVNDLAADRSGTMYAATNGGAYAVLADGTVRRLLPGAFAAVAVWRGDPVFASRGGLSFVDGNGFRTRGPSQGVRADGPSALADCGELLCVGAGDGLWLFDGTAAVHESSATGDLPEEMATAVAMGEHGFVWAGTLASGLARIGSGPAFQPPVPDGRVFQHALLVHGGAVLAGTPGGLVVVRGGRSGIVRELAPVTALAASARGGFWVGLRGAALRVELADAPALAEVAR